MSVDISPEAVERVAAGMLGEFVAGFDPQETATMLRALRTAVTERDELLAECAGYFKLLRQHNVFVWPNHPLNPEERIAAMRDGK